MKNASLAAVAFGLLTLAACNRSNPDALNENDINAQNLDELSNAAANVASESQELQNQAANLENQAQNLDNASGAQTPADENIQGM